MNMRNLFEIWYRSEYPNENFDKNLYYSDMSVQYVNDVTEKQFGAFCAGIDCFVQRIKTGTVFVDDNGVKFIVVHEGVDYYGVYTTSPDFEKEYLEIKLLAKSGFRVELQECKTGTYFLATISKGE